MTEDELLAYLLGELNRLQKQYDALFLMIYILKLRKDEEMS